MTVKDRDWMRYGAAPDPESAAPVLSMSEGAVMLHEMFLSYVDAGFTEAQVMQLLVAILQRQTDG